jgi:hypothetical protein
VGDLAGLGKTRLAPLLGDLQALRAHADVHIDDSEAAALPQLAAEVEGDLPAVRALTRRVPHDWWVYSFTQLAHADAGAGSDIEAAATELPAPAADEPAGPELPLEPALPEPAAAPKTARRSTRASWAAASATCCTRRWRTSTSPHGVTGSRAWKRPRAGRGAAQGAARRRLCRRRPG